MKKFWSVCAILALTLYLGMIGTAHAAGMPTGISGVVERSVSHVPVAGVVVEALGIGTNQTLTTHTDAHGSYSFSNVAPGQYRMIVLDQRYSQSSQLIIPVFLGETSSARIEVVAVIAHLILTTHPGARLISPQDTHNSSQTQVVLGQQQVAMLQPTYGSGSLLATAPGVQYVSYSSLGNAKGMLSVRGLKQGWANNAGIVENGTIGVTLNGVYLNNPQTGIWEPNEIPDLSTLAGAVVTYGPGDPFNRTFDSIGGTIDFFTLSPSQRQSLHVSSAVGSYGAQTYGIRFNTPLTSHSAILFAQGRQFGNSFRQIYGGGAIAPGTGYATLLEYKNSFARGTLTLMGYNTNGTAMRPNLVPLTPLTNGPANPTQVVTVNGFDTNGNAIPGTLYSQATCGYYCALPLNVWNKTTQNSTRVMAADYQYQINDHVSLSNLLSFRHGDRLHVKDLNFDQQDNTQRFEYNNPFSNAYSDRLVVSDRLGSNLIGLGLEGFYAQYQTRNAFWNANPIGPGGFPPTTITNPAKFRSNDFYLNNFSVFLQDEIQAGPRFRFTPGLRYVGLATSFVNNGDAAFPGCVKNPDGTCANNQTTQPNSQTLFRAVEPSISAHFDATPALAFYASLARSLRNPPTSPGGPYQKVSVTGLLPEIGDDAEIGTKFLRRLGGATLDGKPRFASFTLGFFNENFLNQWIPISVGGSGGKQSSASGSSRYSGLTSSFAIDPASNLELFGSYSVTHAIFVNYVSGGTSYSGLPVTQTPTSTFNLGMSYDVPVGKNLLVGRIADAFTGPQAMWDNNNGTPSLAGLQIPSYNLVNAGLSYTVRSGSKPLTFGLSVTNLFDKQYNPFEYVTSGNYFAGGDGQGTPIGAGGILADPGAPREVQFSVSFGN